MTAPNRKPQYRTITSGTYSSLQRALMAGLSPLLLRVRLRAPRDGWLPYFVSDDPQRQRAEASGEIGSS